RSYSARCLAVRRVVECNCTERPLSQKASVAVPCPPKRAFQRLEPCAVKTASTVLRGGRWQQCHPLTRYCIAREDQEDDRSGADFRTRRSAWDQVVASIKERNCGGQKDKIRRDEVMA